MSTDIESTSTIDLSEMIARGEVIYDHDRGEYIDVRTGLVIEEGVISLGKEWREYSPEDKMARSRVGPQLTNKVHDAGLTSYIDPRGSIGRKYSRLNTATRKPSDYRARKEVEAKMIMNDAVAKLGLPNFVAETVGMMIKEASKENLLRKNMIAAMVGAMIAEVCRIYGIPLEMRRLKETLRIDEKSLHNATKKLSWAGIFNELKKKSRERGDLDSRSPMSPATYIPKIAGSLGLSDNIVILSKRILDVLKKVDPTSASGKNPEGTAAASVYLASIILENKRSQKAMADLLGISEVTIRNRYRDIVDNLDIIIYI
jgi:transcription initiation factor TFIIB